MRVGCWQAVAVGVALAAPRAALRAQLVPSQVRDSAGVRIVEYDRLPPVEAATWRIDPEPVLTIGVLDGPDEYVLAGLRTAVGLSDDGVVVQDGFVNARLFELKYYDRDGKRVATASRFGQGPYEFQMMAGLERLEGDSIFVLGGDFRFAVFGPRGERLREGRGIAGALPMLDGAWPMSGGRFVIVDGPAGGGEPAAGLFRDRWTYAIYDPSSGERTALERLYAEPMVFEPMTGTFSGRPVRGFYTYPYPFAPPTVVGSGPRGVWLGQGDVAELRRYTREGALRTVLRFNHDPVPITRSDRARFGDLVESLHTGDDAPRWARYARSMDFPDAMPFFEAVEADRDGNLWVQRYEVPWVVGPQFWDVFDEDGKWQATVRVPAELLPPCRHGIRTLCDSIFEVGSDYLLMNTSLVVGYPQVVKVRLPKGR